MADVLSIILVGYKLVTKRTWPPGSSETCFFLLSWNIFVTGCGPSFTVSVEKSHWSLHHVSAVTPRALCFFILLFGNSDLSRPPGGYTPSFHATPPTIWSSKGVIRGCLWGCLCDRDGRGNKRGQILTWTNLFNLWNNAQNLACFANVTAFSMQTVAEESAARVVKAPNFNPEFESQNVAVHHTSEITLFTREHARERVTAWKGLPLFSTYNIAICKKKSLPACVCGICASNGRVCWICDGRSPSPSEWPIKCTANCAHKVGN